MAAASCARPADYCWSKGENAFLEIILANGPAKVALFEGIWHSNWVSKKFLPFYLKKKQLLNKNLNRYLPDLRTRSSHNYVRSG